MKEKVKIEEKEGSDVYYEITGMALIFLSLVILGNIGYVGYYVGILVRILFGDWYFIIIGFLIYLGFKLLIKHESVNFSSLRIYGLILIYISLSLLSHVKLYNYTYNFSNNHIAGLWKLYMKYFDNFNYKYIFGSGIILAILYEIICFLLGKIGIIIISILLFLSSIAFLSNNTLSNITRKTKTGFGNVKDFFKNFKNKIKDFGNDTRISIDDLEDINSDDLVNKGNIYENKLKINEIFKNNKLSYEFVDYKVSYLYTRLSYYVDIDSLDIFKNYNDLIVIKNDLINIDILNENKNLLTLKKLMLMAKNEFVLGLDINNQLLLFDYNQHQNILINGAKEEIINYVNSLIVQLLLIGNNVLIYDEKKEFNFNKRYIDNINDILEIISNREDDFQTLKINDIEESDERRLFVIVNGLDNINRSSILYIIKNGFRYGVHLIVINEDIRIEDSIRSAIKSKIVFKSSLKNSLALIENSMATNLYIKSDFIFRCDSNIMHIQSAYISNSDLKKFF